MPPHLKWILPSALLAASAAQADPIAQEVSVGAALLRYDSFLRPSEPVTTLEASYQRAVGAEGFWSILHVGGGLRFAFPTNMTTFPLEAFARADLHARMGVWEPATGLELGVSRIAQLTKRTRITWPTFAVEEARLGPVYLTVRAAPLRFHVGRFVLGGPELQVGPSGPPFGAVYRLQLTLARVEMSL
jgi:hypothetical protein